MLGFKGTKGNKGAWIKKSTQLQGVLNNSQTVSSLFEISNDQ